MIAARKIIRSTAKRLLQLNQEYVYHFLLTSIVTGYGFAWFLLVWSPQTCDIAQVFIDHVPRLAAEQAYLSVAGRESMIPWHKCLSLAQATYAAYSIVVAIYVIITCVAIDTNRIIELSWPDIGRVSFVLLVLAFMMSYFLSSLGRPPTRRMQIAIVHSDLPYAIFMVLICMTYVASTAVLAALGFLNLSKKNADWK